MSRSRADSARSTDRSCGSSSTTSAWRNSSRKATFHSPITGWVCPSDAATASLAPSLVARLMQARDKVARQEWAIGCCAQNPCDVRTLRRGPVERREHAGERPGKTLHRVGDDRQFERGKTRRIAVGVEDRGRRIAGRAARSRGRGWFSRRWSSAACRRRPSVARARLRAARRRSAADQSSSRLPLRLDRNESSST